MKKIILGLFIVVIVSVFLFGKHIPAVKDEIADDGVLIMVAPDLDLSLTSEEDMAILIEQGWDFSGEVPKLRVTEEDAGHEVIDGVVNLSDLFDEMDQGMDETE